MILPIEMSFLMSVCFSNLFLTQFVHVHSGKAVKQMMFKSVHSE